MHKVGIYLHYRLIELFLNLLLDVDIKKCWLMKRKDSGYSQNPGNYDINFIGADKITGLNKRGSIKLIKTGNYNIYKITYDYKKRCYLRDYEYKLIKPFDAHTLNKYLDYLEITINRIQEYRSTHCYLSPKIEEYCDYVFRFYHHLTNNDVVYKMNSSYLVKPQFFKLNNRNMFPVPESVLIIKTRDRKLMSLKTGLN